MAETVRQSDRVRRDAATQPLAVAWHAPVAVVLALGLVLALVQDHPVRGILGVLAAVVVYPVLLRWAVWSWLAALAVAPVALGVGAGSWLDVPLARPTAALVVLAIAALLWQARQAWLAATVAAVGLVAGVAVAAAFGLPDLGVVAVVVTGLPALVALVAATGLGRASGSTALRIAGLVAVLAPLSSAFGVVAWWPAAGALGLTALLRGRRGPDTTLPQVDRVDHETLAQVAEDLAGRRLAPVAIVIAAYNEAEGLPAVLADLPVEVSGLATDVIIVDDGSTDGTAEAAAADPRAVVAACTANRGQGAALRLGYRIARTHGAAYIVTTDADGQYGVDDIPAILAPVLDGRADFVTGSRRLGRLQNHDRVRQAGTYVFAWLASVLLGQHLTDTSFGMRAMRAEVTGAVTLNQPQYQASELLVGVVSHGYRVLEVPGTMHVRSAGSSKKGKNLVYGSRYARVMLGSWWREACPVPVTEAAPALRATPRGVSRGVSGR